MTALEREHWRFLDEHSDWFPFRVDGPASISGFDGDKYGECISRPVPEGRRTWAFADEASRDRFAAVIHAGAASR